MTSRVPNRTSAAASASVQAWAQEYITSRDLGFKTKPPPPPTHFDDSFGEVDLRPGRPPELQLSTDKPRSFKLGSLQNIQARAELHHKLWHHELQAAELMCWALLRFPDTPVEFKKGLVGIVHDEIRHMSLYEKRLASWGVNLGDFPVRDWFWERVPESADPTEFVALVGMGLEAANLDHTERFGAWFRTLGDEASAEIQDQVGREEVAHVRFATHWFRKWTGGVDFSTWCEKLPPPLTPMLMRGKRLHRERRRQAAFPESFSDSLAQYQALPTSNRRRK